MNHYPPSATHHGSKDDLASNTDGRISLLLFRTKNYKNRKKSCCRGMLVLLLLSWFQLSNSFTITKTIKAISTRRTNFIQYHQDRSIRCHHLIHYKNWFNNNCCIYVSLKLSSSNLSESKNRKNLKPVTKTQSNNKKMKMTQQKLQKRNGRQTNKVKKEEGDLNALVSNMGLIPATTTKNTTTKKNKTRKIQVQKKNIKNSSTEDNDIIMKKYQQPEELNLKTQLEYTRNGHTVMRKYINPEFLKQIRKKVIKYSKQQELNAWKQKVEVASNSKEIANKCNTIDECQYQLELLGIYEQLPFLQYFNTWRIFPEIKQLSYLIAPIISTLLDIPSIRLYQDAIFWKRSNDGPTPWHVDAKMAPFDTSHLITIWIPLQDIPSDGTGTALLFCSKSHNDFALPYWNSQQSQQQQQQQDNYKKSNYNSEWGRLEHRYPKQLIDYMPMSLGDVTVHSGWTLHCANENNSSKDRLALAISYVDAEAEIRQDVIQKKKKKKKKNNKGMSSFDGHEEKSEGRQGDNEDQWSYQEWVKDVKPRTKFQHEFVPIVWPPQQQQQ